MKPIHFSHAVPFLPVKDLKETVRFYKDKLGFSNEWFWEDSDAGLERDDLHLLFNKNPEHVSLINSNGQAFEICWFVQNVDAIYEEFKGKGVVIDKELENKPWGMREFTIFDNNGYAIRIGQGIEESTSI
ncbi:MAG: bleomycin resistance protein [Chitinophagales bacterium]